MDEFERAYAEFVSGKRVFCAHSETQPINARYTACTKCGAKFAVVQ